MSHLHLFRPEPRFNQKTTNQRSPIMNHNPGRTVRSCLLRYGFVSLTLTASACSSPPEAEKAAARIPGQMLIAESSLALSDLVGQWETTDPETDHLTRVEILKPDSTDRFFVRMWGSCQPECFWGENPAVVVVGDSSNAVIPELSIEWELEHSVPSQRIRLTGKDLLQVDTHHATSQSG